MKKRLVKKLVLFILLSPLAHAETTQVFWGDTHLHTSYSFDVYLFGTPNATPDTAYRYAKGLPVLSPTTQTTWQINDPLDFLVIADHAELVGSIPRVFNGDPLLANTKSGKKLAELGKGQDEDSLIAVYGEIVNVGSGRKGVTGLTIKDVYTDLHADDKRKTTWDENIEAAERHNQPGIFTALIGWEWSSQPDANNLHRVVFMPQGGKTASQFMPYSQFESDDPMDLWKWLDNTSEKLGADFVAIPHNPNVSGGKMFPLVTLSGDEISPEYAKARMKWEPLIEATQIKGDSEAHPLFSPDDEFADFETFPFMLSPDGATPDPTEGSYVRSGLKRGLELQTKIGINPFKVGMIGSTDSHTGMPAIEENNFSGKGQHDAFPGDRSKHTGIGSSKGWDMAASGYVGVWAKENTRQDIFDAFKRKEVYASTGPRISLRFFGGYDFSDADITGEDIAATGYAKGVPMGGDLTPNSQGKAPSFLLQALKDPKGAKLDRIQIIKGWVDSNGKTQEKVFNVAAADGRKITNNQLALVGNTVDIKTGRYSNTIGDNYLTTVWQDPEFNSAQAAFYYVRVLEIPTPRYSLLDAISLNIDPAETGKPATIQERVYSSPIWYTPY